METQGQKERHWEKENKRKARTEGEAEKERK